MVLAGAPRAAEPSARIARRTNRSRPAVCVLAVALALTAAPAHAAEQRFSRTFTLAPGAPLRIDATIADVVVAGTTDPQLAVDIVRRAPSDADLARYPVVVDEGHQGLAISTIQADGGVDPALKTEIRLSVPADVRLEQLQVFEGHVRLSNLRGTCHVAIRRGDIDATGLGGRVRLQTELGAIDVRGAELTRGGMMHLRTFNGDVRVRFAQPPHDARILAITYNGTITSDVPLAMKDRFGPHFGETTLGRGEPVLSIDIVKGNVAIKLP